MVEIGVGGRWEALRAVARARPDLKLLATDVHPRRLEGAPEGVATAADDVTAPREALYEGAVLLYAVRAPEELQAAIARLARSLGAGLALSVVKDEWADLAGIVGAHRVATGSEGRSWRVWPSHPKTASR